MIFIRPLILLLLLVPIFFYLTKDYRQTTTPWTKWVDKKLLSYLLVKGDKVGTRHRYWYLIFLWSLLVCAAAGPAFQKIPVPVSQDLPNTVIIFDLGPAMRESTLTSAKIKLHDLLTALKGNRVGLVLYADKGYTALPLTPDRSLLRALIPTLDPSVLPNHGQNLVAAFQKANELIQQTGGKGRILYLTAGGVDAQGISTPYPVGVLGLDDKAVSSSLKKIGSYEPKTTDASDILALLDATEPDTAIQLNMQDQADEWADWGGLITLILLPFLAFTFRKGLLFLILLGALNSANASFFLRPDQEAYRQHQQAVNDYRSGAYEKAIIGFQNDAYNQGNALAYAGKIQEAIQSYEKALKEDPKNEDARFNKEYLEKQLPPPEQNQQKNQDQQQSKQDQQKDDSPDQQEDQSNQNNEQESSSEREDQSQVPPQEQQSQNNEAENEEQNKPNQPQEQAAEQQPQEVEEADKEHLPFNQEEQQLLNRLRSDPYRVLRYRLQQQARQK